MDVNRVASVASFFVSRVDTLTDRYLEEILKHTEDENERRRIQSLMGKAAVANAKMAYQVFKRGFSSDRFLKLRLKGAKVQRLLFGSTSTKNPSYSDVLYVEELIGPGTVNTMPDSTWRAFKNHGKVARTLDADVQKAEDILREIESLGISLDRVTKELEDEGVRLFVESFDAVLDVIAEKRKSIK
jgi:transaldolase